MFSELSQYDIKNNITRPTTNIGKYYIFNYIKTTFSKYTYRKETEPDGQEKS